MGGREMYLVVEIPPEKSAYVFRIEHIWNQYKILNYGPLPIPAGTPLKTFTGTSAVAPADGALAPLSYIEGVTFPMQDVYDPNDMWDLPASLEPARLFITEQHITPEFLRVNAYVPINTVQAAFQRSKLPLRINDLWGWKRGYFKMVHFPNIIVGYNYANDTSFPTYTHVKFIYDEYVVSIPSDPALIFNILAGFVPEKLIRRVTYPIVTMPTDLKAALGRLYGFLGFELPKLDRRAEFERKYAEILSSPAVRSSYLGAAGGIR
jgi:hypothetical protein